MDPKKVTGAKVWFKEPEVIDDADEPVTWKVHKVGQKRKRTDDQPEKEGIPPLKLQRVNRKGKGLDQRGAEKLAEYNQALVESRKSPEGYQDAKGDAVNAMSCYNQIRDRMKENGKPLENLKDKTTDEIRQFLLKEKIIDPQMSKWIKDDEIDLEGSPFW